MSNELDTQYDCWAVDEGNNRVLFFETRDALEEWMLTGRKTWVASRPTTPDDFA